MVLSALNAPQNLYLMGVLAVHYFTNEQKEVLKIIFKVLLATYGIRVIGAVILIMAALMKKPLFPLIYVACEVVSIYAKWCNYSNRSSLFDRKKRL